MTHENELELVDDAVPETSTTEIKFDPDQLKAIEAGCDVDRRLVAITGPAGTGKTRLIKEIYARLTAAGYSGQISAPTGKAAKRVGESTGYVAVTNHRLLGYGMPVEIEREDEETGKKTFVEISTGPRYSRSNPLPYDFLIGDEYAMVNETIHTELMAALKPGARIIMLGDANQLKPIEEGGWKNKGQEPPPSPFQRALEKFNGITLNTIHRQSEGSGIAKSCALILRGSVPRSEPDFQVVFSDKPTDKLKDMFFDLADEGYDFASANCQIISPTNKTWVGVEKINAMIQSMLFDRSLPFIQLPRHNKRDWKTGKPVLTPEIRIQEGTKVVYTANTYDLNDEHKSSVFNGEVGIVVGFSDDGSVDIDFGDRVLSIPPLIVTVKDDGTAFETDPRKNINLAYCLTTHKMQGSECKAIIYVLNKSSQFIQNRANFYTAVSRARTMCFVLTDQLSIRKSVIVKG